MSLSPADREWIRKQLRRVRAEIHEDTHRTLSDVLGEEAAVAVFQAMQKQHPPA